MEDAELVGGVLDGSSDPVASAKRLAALLGSPLLDINAVRRADLDPDLVDVLRVHLEGDVDRIQTACREGAIWVLGRRSINLTEPWDLVASLPPSAVLPPGLHRTTGETLAQLVAEAKRTLRLAAPFIDRLGLSYLVDALAAATGRGVEVEALLPTRSSHADDALDELRDAIRESGLLRNLRTSRLRFDAPWAHLKVVVSDSISAYVGSANVTGAGLAGQNLELGVLVRGYKVAVVDALLDLYRQR